MKAKIFNDNTIKLIGCLVSSKNVSNTNKWSHVKVSDSLGMDYNNYKKSIENKTNMCYKKVKEFL